MNMTRSLSYEERSLWSLPIHVEGNSALNGQSVNFTRHVDVSFSPLDCPKTFCMIVFNKYHAIRHINCNVLFQIKVTDVNEPPTDIGIIGSWEVEENSPAGTMIGTLTTVDSDVGQQYTYSLLAVAQRFLLLFKFICM